MYTHTRGKSERGVGLLAGAQRGPTVGRTNLFIFPAHRHGEGNTKIESEILGQGLACARLRPVRLRRLASSIPVYPYKGKQASEVTDS